MLQAHRIRFCINPLFRKLTERELIELVGEAEVIIAGTEPITRRVMEKATQLRHISRVGVGLDNVDLVEAEKRGISVSYTPDAPAPAVATLPAGSPAAELLKARYTLSRYKAICGGDLPAGWGMGIMEADDSASCKPSSRATPLLALTTLHHPRPRQSSRRPRPQAR